MAPAGAHVGSGTGSGSNQAWNGKGLVDILDFKGSYAKPVRAWLVGKREIEVWTR